MSNLRIIRNFCNNNINELNYLSPNAKKILNEKSLQVIKDQKNKKSSQKYLNFRKKAIEILNTFNEKKYCLFQYKLIKIEKEQIYYKKILLVEKDGIKYNVVIEQIYAEKIGLYEKLLDLYKRKELPDLNLYKNFCEIESEKLYLYGQLNNEVSEKLLKWMDINESLKNERHYNVIITEISKKLIDINSSNFTDENLFLLFYYYFICFCNGFLCNKIDYGKPYLIKYGKKIIYSICGHKFQSNIMKNIIFIQNNVINRFEFEYVNIRGIKTSSVFIYFDGFLEDYVYKDNENKLFKYMEKNKESPAIDTLLYMANKIFTPINELKNDKIDLIFSCEQKEIDLETSIPPIAAYADREYNYPRFIETGRPKSYMIQMCKQIVPSLSDETCLLLKNNLFLPVLRYQNIFHKEKTVKTFCGTFYYFEPESSVMLNLGRCAMFGSKIHAYIVLLAVKNKTTKEKELNKLFNPKYIENLINERKKDKKKGNFENDDIKQMQELWYDFKGDTKITTKQLIEIQTQFYIPIFYKESEVKEIPTIKTTALYPSDESSEFDNHEFSGGTHDDFDQPICKLAREFKIDTIILQHENGETRAVSEILDTRLNTYDQLVRIKDYKSTYKVSKKYPTIFFLEQGFIMSTTSKCKKVDIDRDDMNVLKCV